MFQSPYGARGRSDKFEKTEVIGNIHDKFQSPYGVRGGSNEREWVPEIIRSQLVSITLRCNGWVRPVHNPEKAQIIDQLFQSPYGVRGRSDMGYI